MVRTGGVEPPHPLGRQDLNLVRLPIPPRPQLWLGPKPFDSSDHNVGGPVGGDQAHRSGEFDKRFAQSTVADSATVTWQL